MQNKSSVGKKEFIVLMATLMSVVAISIDAALPSLGVIGKDLGATTSNQTQFIISFIFAGMALGQLISGPLSDALGRKKILYGGLTLYLIGSVICLFSNTMEIMLFGRFIQGLGVSGPYISTVSIVRDKFSGRSMARVMSLVMMIFIMVPTIAPALGQGLLYLGSWHYIFVLYIIYALFVMMWSKLRLEETHPIEKRIPFSLKNIIHGAKTVLGNRATTCYLVCMGAVFGALIGYLSSCRQIFQEQFEIGDMFVVFFGLQAMSFGVSSMVNSFLVERLGMRYLSFVAVGGILLSSSLFLGIILTIDVTFWMFFVYAVLLLFNFGLLFGNLNALAMEPMGHIAGIASAIIGSFSSVISLVLGTTIGQLYDGTLVPIVSGFFCLGLLALTFMLLAEKRKQLVTL